MGKQFWETDQFKSAVVEEGKSERELLLSARAMFERHWMDMPPGKLRDLLAQNLQEIEYHLGKKP